ncbi:SDR family NAD(P)-dependent oxidoreductase, partial [Streptomyces flavofungini]|uniref:SDR family NAD(P)-dependent oxidoreductase n=1 Tax=Streptomyces flavofungini TaxID=68200 RepID=UPI0034E015EB
MPGLGGRIALVTGASGGIGAGIAVRFAEAGAAVVVHYRRGQARAREVVERIGRSGGEAVAVAADLAEEEGCRELVRAAQAWRGRLDCLVNSAGVQPVRELPGMTAAQWREVAEANVTSAFCCTQAAAEVMAGQDGGGSVTHIASIEGTNPAAGHAHYSASKAALIMFARSAALEYGPRGIRVNTVSPGLVDRPGLSDDWPEGAAAPLGQ